MTWQNWSGSLTATPTQVAVPVDAAAAAEVLTRAGEQNRRVRPLGSGHSFSPIGAPTDVAVSLAALTGVGDIDPATGRVWVGAGTRLRDLNRGLQQRGRALPNLGDIDAQTIAGAVATGTHGTGLGLQGIAAAVTGVELATADGRVTRHAAGDGTFEAARINLGALGIVTALELETVPAFRLRAVEGPLPLDAVLADPRGFAASADHAEFFWFPHTDVASTRRNHRAGADEMGPLPAVQGWVQDELLANGAYAVVNRVGAAIPRLVPALNRLSAATLGERTYADVSHRVFCSPRRVRFVESEYAVPLEAVADVLGELRRWYDRTQAPVQFPVEVRFLAADDVWLSGAYGRDSAYIAVHQYHRGDVGDSFDVFERIVAEHDGRPHWGKQHTLDAARLAQVHPRWEDFVAVRNRLDPARVLASPHLDAILGP
ncbi:MAG: D-arabinono-1,4-lactone oxidase [Propionibacteriaceae bacterium]|nr:D-arabinono-1,4-lactone oxidase [Propionibacteriaceae bacterium]